MQQIKLLPVPAHCSHLRLRARTLECAVPQGEAFTRHALRGRAGRGSGLSPREVSDALRTSFSPGASHGRFRCETIRLVASFTPQEERSLGCVEGILLITVLGFYLVAEQPVP
jgi:hypothetical protein